jgi:O-succinylbenzoate synthase
MRLEELELRRISLPLVTPFRTSFGTQVERDALVVAARTDAGVGWGECTALTWPGYSSEWIDGAQEVIRRFLVPLLGGDDLTADRFHRRVAGVVGHPMAKAALELALLDAELRAGGTSLRDRLGGSRDRVEVGVSVGITDTLAELVDLVAGYVDDGYTRVKLKIEPGWDLEPVRAVRERWPELRLQVDANTAYGPGDLDHLAGLDAFDLLLIEQPFPEDDLLTHRALARHIATPVCLDESITSLAVTATAIELGACSVVNIKPGRIGGYLPSAAIHDLCRAAGVAVWCGGMLETGIGRAANLALASLPGFTLPGDISGTARYYHHDVTAPFVVEGGTLPVPTGPGIGVDVDAEALAAATTSVEVLRP